MNEPENIEPAFGVILGGIFAGVPIMGVSLTAAVLLLLIILYFMQRLRKKLGEARALLEQMAVTDDLTGVLNRSHLLARFEEEFQEHRRQKTELGCLLIDLDDLKKVNEAQGHLTGDAVLKEFARMTKSCIRIYDIFGRFGGEEFIILLPITTLVQAMTFAERVRKTVEKDLVVKSGLGDEVRMTISLGATILRDGDASVDAVIRRAEEALFKAKASGRNRAELS
jgi:two-component system cell cycle response regulator